PRLAGVVENATVGIVLRRDDDLLQTHRGVGRVLNEGVEVRVVAGVMLAVMQRYGASADDGCKLRFMKGQGRLLERALRRGGCRRRCLCENRSGLGSRRRGGCRENEISAIYLRHGGAPKFRRFMRPVTGRVSMEKLRSRA